MYNFQMTIETNRNGTPASEQTPRLPQDRMCQVLDLFTPPEVLENEVFDQPDVITPMNFPSFASLLAEREKIRKLQLVPVKDDFQYTLYHGQSPENLLESLLEKLGKEEIIIAKNDFPYFLPDDVDQNIVWLKAFVTPNQKIADYILKVLMERNVAPEKAIIFERPLATQSKLVRGTFRHLRHVHLWLPNS